MNRITSINSFLDGVSDFTYDKRSQLLTANHAAPRADENYSFDDNGNRNMSGYATGGNNQTTSDGVYNYTFDNEGNRLRKTKISDNSYEEYTWDHRNRLTRVTFKNQSGTTLRVVDYTNDVFNRLVQRVYDSNGPAAGGVSTTYLVGYDGINPTLAFDGANTSDLTNRFLWGPAIDQLIADEQVTNPTSAGNTIWPLGDHLGTLRDLADFNSGTASFSITNHRVYDSFGRLTSESNTAVDEYFAYTGKYFDDITGLSNHWHRWYDPQLGKWISEDPIGFAGGDANLARYVDNRATGSRDAYGLQEDDDGPRIGPRESSLRDRAMDTIYTDDEKQEYDDLMDYETWRDRKGLPRGAEEGQLDKMNRHLNLVEGNIAMTERTLENPGLLLVPGTGGVNIWDNGLIFFGGFGGGLRIPGVAPAPPKVPYAAPKSGIVAQNGTTITGYTKHGINRATGNGFERAGTSPKAILEALKNPKSIKSGVDDLGRPFKIFTGPNARVVVNPQTGEIVSVNPLGGGGVRGR